MIGKNITEKRWIVVIVALIIIFSGVVVALSIQGLASTKANNLTNSVELTKDIGGGHKNVFGYNSTGKDPTWEVVLCTSSSSATMTAADVMAIPCMSDIFFTSVFLDILSLISPSTPLILSISSLSMPAYILILYAYTLSGSGIPIEFSASVSNLAASPIW